MKNKKGFTLVELMAVIVILAIIISVAVPSALAISKRIKNKMYDTKVDMILDSAKIYGQDHPQGIPTNGCKTIVVKDLIDNGYIKKDNTKDGTVINPSDNSTMNNLQVCLYKENNRIYAKTYSTSNNVWPGTNENDITITMKIGDYVSMTPTKTSFTVPMTLTGYTADQTIDPSELNLWRVIRINSDNTVDMVSEYVSSTTVYFKGQTGYQNFIGTLNYIAEQYENPKYTSGSRHMGYSNQTEYIRDTSALTTTTAPQTADTSSSNVTSTTEAKGLGDMGYETDYNLVNTALGTRKAYKVGTTTATAYWLASRSYVYTMAPEWFFGGRYVYTSGSLYNNYLYYYYGRAGFTTYNRSDAIRPILTLRSGVKASSGSGTSASPYVLK